MTRTLKSKHLRALLWYAAGGKCQICGGDLMDDWEADHVIPWSASRRTNVHEMQALCRKCNRSKGDKMLRKHQREFEEVVSRHEAGECLPSRIIAIVTPGGGKSWLPMIATKHLIPFFADKLCWVVPRVSLADQAETDFAEMEKPLGLPGQIRWSPNRPNPSRSHIGYVTTYQAIGSCPELHESEFGRHRYILVLDEPHHVGVGLPWDRALRPLVDRACLVVMMSGTIEKGNGKPVAFLTYDTNGEVNLRTDGEQKVIHYTRATAIEESAIVPVEFEHVDAAAEWVDKDGRSQQRDTFGGANEDTARAMIFTALATEYSQHLLRRGIDHWNAFRQANPWAQLLIVSRDISSAKRDAEYASHLIGSQVTIATDDDNAAARKHIKHFCCGDLKALATVCMAYEGMDAKAVSHLICLTNIRSKPWIEQMIGRVVRTYPGKDRGYVFCPDDPLMNAVIDSIREEQIAAAKLECDVDRAGSKDATTCSVGETPSGIIPQCSQSTDVRVSAFNAPVELTAGQIRWLDSLGLTGVSKEQIRQLIDAIKTHGDVPEVSGVAVNLSGQPSQREEMLRKRIEERCRSVDVHFFAAKFGTANTEVKQRFGIGRRDMTEQQLCEVWGWMNRRWPIQ